MFLLFACDGTEPTTPTDIAAGARLGDALAFDAAGDLLVTAPGSSEDGVAVQVQATASSIGDAKATWVAAGAGDLGGDIAPCADADGDGRPEVIVGLGSTSGRGGAEWLPDGLGTAPVDAVRVDGSEAAGGLGDALACADVTGDDRIDLVISAPYADGFGLATAAGVVRVFTEAPAFHAAATYTTTFASGRLGTRGALAPLDLDGDGVGDLAVGAPGSDDVYGVPGPMAGSFDNNNTGANWYGPGLSEFGAAVVAADFDADGHDDLAVGAPSYGFEAGAVVILQGPFDPDVLGSSDEGVRQDGGAGAGSKLAVLATDPPALAVGSDGRVDIIQGPFAPMPLAVAAVAQVSGQSRSFAATMAADPFGGLAVGDPDAASGDAPEAGVVRWFEAGLLGSLTDADASGMIVP